MHSLGFVEVGEREGRKEMVFHSCFVPVAEKTVALYAISEWNVGGIPLAEEFRSGCQLLRYP